MKLIKKIIFIFIFINIFSVSSFTEENIKNKIYKNLRCLVCQGQSISDSNSDFAQTIKSVVDEKIENGMQEKEIYKFMADKYGDWILYNPPIQGKSYILWILPYLFFIVGVIALLLLYKKTLKDK
mgnify:CR=1 FL=1|tara:strand:- start:106 stop:480 length:375 start_codon:yes stop_codon:yes gene_type:complete